MFCSDNHKSAHFFPFFAKPLDKARKLAYNNHITVEAEITHDKTTQRARDAENRVRNYPANGPLRAQSKELLRVFCDAGPALSVEGMSVPQKEHAYRREARWHRGSLYSSLTEGISLSRIFYLEVTRWHCLPNDGDALAVRFPPNITHISIRRMYHEISKRRLRHIF